MHTYGHWHSLTELKTEHRAFTYKVWFPQLNKRYIGVKKLFTPHGKEYKWRDYPTSSEYVHELIDAGYVVYFTIVEWFDSYSDGLAAEVNAQNAYDVLTRDEYLNRNIGGKWSGHTEESRAKISAWHTGKVLSDETKAKLSGITKKQVFTKERNAKISASHLGKKKTFEHATNISKATRGQNNHQFKGWYITPAGVFETTQLAADANNCSDVTVARRCIKQLSKKFITWDFIPKDNFDDST